MKRFNLDDGDGKIDRGEFILLCAVRVGALSPDLVQTINERFKELDTDQSGTLDVHEILETEEETRERESRVNQQEHSMLMPMHSPRRNSKESSLHNEATATIGSFGQQNPLAKKARSSLLQDHRSELL